MKADLLSGRLEAPQAHRFRATGALRARVRHPLARQKAEKNLKMCARQVVENRGPNRMVSTLNKADADTIKLAFLKRQRSDGTINRKLAALSDLANEAIEREFLVNGFKLGLIKERQGRVRFFTEEEEQAMPNFCKATAFDDLRDYIIVSVDTGLQQGEVLKIQKRDTGFDYLWTYDTKNGQNRDVWLTGWAREVLEQRAGAAGCINPDDKIFKLRPRALQHQWRRMKTALEMDGDTEYTPPRIETHLRHENASCRRGYPHRAGAVGAQAGRDDPAIFPHFCRAETACN